MKSMEEMYVLPNILYIFANAFVIIGFEVDELYLLHTFVFESLPTKPLELTLQNIDECFSRRGSEGKTTRRGSPAEEDPKHQRTKFKTVKKKSK